LAAGAIGADGSDAASIGSTAPSITIPKFAALFLPSWRKPRRVLSR